MGVPNESLIRQTVLCEHAPFGAAFITADGPVDFSRQPEAAEQLATLRTSLQAIADSPHLDDQYFISQFNNNTRRWDAPAWPHRADVLSTTDPMDWLLDASDYQLLSFMADTIERQRYNQARLARLLPDLQEQALYDVGQAVEYGVVPRVARSLAELTLAKTTYLALDSMESAENFCIAYYHDKGIMGLADAYEGWSDMKKLFRVFTHETFHGLNILANAGLQRILPGPRLPLLESVEEFWTEHCTQVTRSGEPGAVMPDERFDDNGSYRLDRTLGGIVVADIPYDLIGEAYLEPLIGKQTARREFNRQLRRNFPKYALGKRGNIFHKIARELQATPIIHQPEILTRWIDRLYPGTTYDEIPGDDPLVALSDSKGVTVL